MKRKNSNCSASLNPIPIAMVTYLVVILLTVIHPTLVSSMYKNCEHETLQQESTSGLSDLITDLGLDSMESSKLWTYLGSTIMKCADCQRHMSRHWCTHQMTCSQLLHQALKPSNRLTRQARHSPAIGRFAGDLVAYPFSHSKAASITEQHGNNHFNVGRSSRTSRDGAREDKGRPPPNSDFAHTQLSDSHRFLLDELKHRTHHGLHNAMKGDGPGNANRGGPSQEFRLENLRHNMFQHLPPHPQTRWWLEQDKLYESLQPASGIVSTEKSSALHSRGMRFEENGRLNSRHVQQFQKSSFSGDNQKTRELKNQRSHPAHEFSPQDDTNFHGIPHISVSEAEKIDNINFLQQQNVSTNIPKTRRHFRREEDDTSDVLLLEFLWSKFNRLRQDSKLEERHELHHETHQSGESHENGHQHSEDEDTGSDRQNHEDLNLHHPHFPFRYTHTTPPPNPQSEKPDNWRHNPSSAENAPQWPGVDGQRFTTALRSTRAPHGHRTTTPTTSGSLDKYDDQVTLNPADPVAYVPSDGEESLTASPVSSTATNSPSTKPTTSGRFASVLPVFEPTYRKPPSIESSSPSFSDLQYSGPERSNVFNESSVSVRLLFALLRLSGNVCREDNFNDFNSWIKHACSRSAYSNLRREKRQTWGVHNSEDIPIYTAIQEDVRELKHRLVAALALWNPDRVGESLWSGQWERYLLERQKCFVIHQLVSFVEDSLYGITVNTCHYDLYLFLSRLTSVLFSRLLKGQRPLSESSLCPIDFVSDIFQRFGVTNQQQSCSERFAISLEGLQNILNTAQPPCDIIHPQSMTSSNHNSQRSQDWQGESNSLSRETNSEGAITNITARQLVNIVFVDNKGVFNLYHFYQMCPGLLQQLLLSSQTEEMQFGEDKFDGETTELRKPSVTGLQSNGMGTAAVAIIMMCTLLGALIVNICRSLGRQFAMGGMMAQAVGYMCADAVLNLLPKALSTLMLTGNTSRTVHLPGGLLVTPMTFKVLPFLAAVYVFWLLELFAAFWQQQSHEARKISVKRDGERSRCSEQALREEAEVTMQPGRTCDEVNHYEPIGQEIKINNIEKTTEFKDTSGHIVWMIMTCDLLHNLVNGLALGTAFAHDIPLGLSAALSAVCRELLHEIGDFAALLSTGMCVKRALVLNLFVGLSAFLGLYAGVALSSRPEYIQWIYMSVVGTFLYVSLVNLVPELVRYFRHFMCPLMFTVQNFGLLVGFALVFLLALLEDKIRFTFVLPEFSSVDSNHVISSQ